MCSSKLSFIIIFLILSVGSSAAVEEKGPAVAPAAEEGPPVPVPESEKAKEPPAPPIAVPPASLPQVDLHKDKETVTAAPDEEAMISDTSPQLTGKNKEALPPSKSPQSAAERAAGPDASDRRGTGVLFVETDPPGAEVFIGNTERHIDTALGETPIEVPLPAKTYYLRLEKDGYMVAVAKVDVRPGEDNWMRVKLEQGDSDRRWAWRLAGNLIFWPGLAVAGAGIGLIFGGNGRDSKAMAKTGYGLAAAGVTMVVSGGIILGLTYQSKGVYTMPAYASAGNAVEDRRVTVVLTKKF